MTLLPLVACAGKARPAREADGVVRQLHGAALVAGSSLQEWNLLAVPSTGGTAELRSLSDPSQVVWHGATKLPAASVVVSASDGFTVVQLKDGTIYGYEPQADRLTRVGAVRPGGTWTSLGTYVLYRGASDSTILQLSRDGNWSYRFASPVAWASVVGGGAIIALVQTAAGPQLLLVGRGESEPAAAAKLPVAPPAVVTAWGRRVAMTSSGTGKSTLQLIAVPELTALPSYDLGSPITALATSPSSHEVYAALPQAGRLVAVNRLSGSIDKLADLEAGEVDIREAALGGYLLVREGGQVEAVTLDGKTADVATAWRADLPIGLPDGRVLGVQAQHVLLWHADHVAADTLDASPGVTWAVVRWNPSPPVVAGPMEGEPVASPESSAALTAPASGAVSEPASEGRVAGGVREPTEGPDAGGPAVSARLAGFYAIVGSARSRAGVSSLTQSLAAAGYPTTIQTHEDDAGQVWYRGLVGPYANREAADAAARQLRRERRLQVWVTEVDTNYTSGDYLQ